MRAKGTSKPSSQARPELRDRSDWQRVDAMGDAAIRKAVATDPDTFIPSRLWWRRAKLVPPRIKESVSLRLDADLLAWFRRSGKGYQARINAVLRSYVEANGSPQVSERKKRRTA